MLRRCRQLCATFAFLLLGACGDAAKVLQDSTPGEPLRAPGGVADVYARIAKAARTCWFGPQGALRKTHLFHADVTPPSRGESAEITVHEMEAGQTSQWGRKTFRVLLAPAETGTSIRVENLAMPDDVARRMRADVFQWSAGNAACSTRAPSADRQAAAPVSWSTQSIPVPSRPAAPR